MQLNLNYPTTKYRETYERTDPEFEIIAHGHQPLPLDNVPPPEFSAEKARFAVQVKFVVCLVNAPSAASLKFDNVRNGGTATDNFIFYMVFEGAYTYMLNPKFTTRSSDCWIKWTLVHKGTDTDVIKEGKWPEISFDG